MLPNHVEIQLLQHLQIVYHRLSARWGVDPIRPETLVQCPKHEDWLTVQDWRYHAANFCFGDGAETGIALYFVVTELDCEIVQSRGAR